MSDQALLTVEGATKRFGAVTALDGVSFEIRRNEFFALLGPSGCGKTTLLRAIAGFEDLDEGSMSIVIDGESSDLAAYPPNRRPVNLMFQSYALFPHMNVRKNIAYGLERERLPKAEITQRVDEALHTVGLTDKATARPAQLSGGQRQRVALARAIVKRPQVLLLDEPLSALDRKVRADMQVELKRLQHEVGITFVVVTHDQEEAMSMADRVAVMNGGRLEQLADPVTLYQRPATRFVADFIGSGTLVEGTAAPAGLQTGERLLPASNPDGLVGPAALLVRPESVVLSAPGEGLLSGTVVESHFYGGSSSTTVQVDNPAMVVVASHPGAPTASPGDRVDVGWAADGAVLVGTGT